MYTQAYMVNFGIIRYFKMLLFDSYNLGLHRTSIENIYLGSIDDDTSFTLRNSE